MISFRPPLDDQDTRALQNSCNRVQAFLDRSQNVLLDIEMMVPCKNALNRESIDVLLTMLVPHSHRYYSISIHSARHPAAHLLYPLQGCLGAWRV